MRRHNDFYETNDKLTQHLLERVDIRGVVAEPCVGDGAISRVLASSDLITGIITNDIDLKFTADYHGDAADPFHSIWDPREVMADWFITNPPFLIASDILPMAYDAARLGVAFLLRLSYLEPCQNRAAWLSEHARWLTDVIIFGQPRPSFTGNGRTDNVTTAWMVWRKPHLIPSGYNTRVDFVPNWKDYFND